MSNPDQLPLIPPADARAAELLRIGVEACNAAGADRQLSSGLADTLEWQKEGWRAIARHVEATAVTWVYCDETLPDDDIRVLFAVDGEDDVEVGHHEGDMWITIEGAIHPDASVYAWAHWPAAPIQVSGLKSQPSSKGGAA